MSMGKAEVICEAKKLATSLGRTPTIHEFQKIVGKKAAVYRNFNSWNDVLDAAGLTRNNTWSKNISAKTLIEQLKNLTIELGRVPTSSEFIAHKETFSVGAVERRFGTWNNFLKAAGFGVKQQMSLGITKDVLIAQVKMLHNELGRTPTSTEFEKDSRTASLHVVRDRFIFYNNLLKAADLKPHTSVDYSHRKKINNEELILQLQSMAKDLGRTPTCSEFKANPATYSEKIAIMRFGTWNNFVKAAGLNPKHRQYGISKEELIKQVKNLAVKLNRRTKYADFNSENGTASVGTVIKRFGSWDNFIKEAGLEE